jgi:hypothetical protein
MTYGESEWSNEFVGDGRRMEDEMSLREIQKEGRRVKRRYVRGGVVPRTIGPGRVLMHNHVRHGPNWPGGMNGFRCWTATEPPEGFVLCPCGYAGLKHYVTRENAAVWRNPKMRTTIQRWVRAEEKRWGLFPSSAQ